MFYASIVFSRVNFLFSKLQLLLKSYSYEDGSIIIFYKYNFLSYLYWTAWIMGDLFYTFAAYFESLYRKRAHDNCRAITHAKCASNAIRISDYAVTSREIIAGNPFSDSRKHDAKKKKKKNRTALILAAFNFDSRVSFSRRKYPPRPTKKKKLHTALERVEKKKTWYRRCD